MQTPILFVGDSPVLKSGLGRIGRDLAILTSRLPEFRVGYFGRGGHYTRSLPFPQYVFQPTSVSEWGETSFKDVWYDFTRKENGAGVVFSIWDPSRVTWIGYPHFDDDKRFKPLTKIFSRPDVERWGYFAVDGQGIGPNGALSGLLSETLRGYDRVLGYGLFGARILTESLDFADEPPVPYLPHGIDMRNFQPRDRKEARSQLGLPSDAAILGCVMTNQPRKDWGAFLKAVQILKQSRPKLDLFVVCRTDDLFMHWNIPALIEDLKIGDSIGLFQNEISDEELSWWYSACDLTVLPSLGEGFGYPLIESLACGVPVVHVNYGGGAELVARYDSSALVDPSAYRIDTRWNILRPVLDPEVLARTIELRLQLALERPDTERCRAAVAEFAWPTLWPQWKEWLLEGLNR